MLKVILLLGFIQLCLAMPMTNQVLSQVRPQCVDKQGVRYGIGYNFQRRDGWICNCTYDNFVTRLTCKSPQLQPSIYYPRPYNPVTTREENDRSIRKDYCVYRDERNRQVYANLNTQWRMSVNGVLMDCSCSSSARLSCRTISQGIYPTQDSADLQCQRRTHWVNEKFAVLQTGGYYSLCVCNSTGLATCQVPTTSGQSCQFPFRYRENFYSTCVSVRSSRAPLCSIGNGRTSQCLTNLNDFRIYGRTLTYNGNSNGAFCHFPFLLNGVQYNQCTRVNRGSLWCATTSNYDRDRRYGYCQPRTNSGGSSSGSVVVRPVESSVYRRVGEPATIECLFQRPSSLVSPTITWYKLSPSGGRQKLYTYHSVNASGAEASSAGIYRGRLNMTNERELIINDMRADDGGTFECEVNYVGSTEVSTRTDVSISSIAGPLNLKYTHYPLRAETQFSWTNPDSDYDAIRLEYQEEGGRSVRRASLPRGRSSYVIRNLRPGVTYRARVYAVNDRDDSAPAQLTFTLPRFTTNRRPSTGVNNRIPTPQQPLVAPRLTESTIFLDWLTNPFVNTEVEEWEVVYVDDSTEEAQNVTIPASNHAYLIENLKSGQRYRVTLYAIVDENRIEVASKNIATEQAPLEIPGAPSVSQSTSTITIRWQAPQSNEVTSYEISYRPLDNPSSQWITHSVPASQSPQDTIRNLMPATRYDIHITPVSVARRGSFLPITAETVNLAPEPSSPLGQPRNVEIYDVTRSSFLARWTPSDYRSNIRYRIRYYPTDDESAALEYTVSSTTYRAVGLDPAQEYTLQVSALAGKEESTPTTASTTTLNEVCEVDNVWKGENEKFYKKNPRGYLQNCTCYKTRSGGRWVCDPIICVSRSGRTYTVGKAWEQENEDGDYYERCICTRVGTQCTNSRPIPRPNQPPQQGAIGSSLVLRCPHETNERTRPVIMWYKLTAAGKVPIYRYDGTTASGTALVESGQQFSRLNMRNEVELVIAPLQAPDSGSYQCTIRYPSSSSKIFHQTDVTVLPQNRPVTVALTFPPEVSLKSSNEIVLTWESPSDRVTGYRVLYRDENGITAESSATVTEEKVVLRHLSPSTTYVVTVIPLIGDTSGEPSIIRVSTENESSRTDPNPIPTPAIPVAPPTNLRFDDVRLTSLRARWSIPFSVEPVDYYKVKYKPQNSDEDFTTRETSRNYLMITDLDPGTAYQVHALSIKNEVESNPIIRVVSTKMIGNIPVRVTNERQSSAGGSLIGSNTSLRCDFDLRLPGSPNVTWFKIDSERGKQQLGMFNGAEGIGQELSETKSNGDYSGRLQVVDLTTLRIFNLKSSDHGMYECEVTFTTGSGIGRTNIKIVGLPNPVVFVSPSVAPDETEHTLSWTADSAPRIQYFLLKIRRRGSSSSRYTEFRPPGGARSFLFRNLRPGETYEGVMTAWNQYGTSPETPFSFSMPSSGQPGPPRSLEIVKATPTQLTLRVNGGTGDIQFYRIRYEPETPVEGVSEKIAEGSSPNDLIVLDEMVPDTYYVLRVSSVNGNGESDSLSGRTKTPKQLPSPPTGVTITELTSRKAVLSIEGLMEDIDYYEIVFRPTDSSQRDRTQRTRSGERVANLVFLQPDTQYQLEIRSVNANGKSSTVRATFSTRRELQPPQQPSILNIVRPRPNEVTLEWSGDTTNVQYYVIEFQAEGESERQIRTTYGPMQRATITGLRPNTNYQVSIKAVGEGGQSTTLTGEFVTQAVAPRLNHVTVNQTRSNEATIEIEETPDLADYYIITFFPVNNERQQTEIRSRSRDVTFSNLLPGTRYRVRVIAVAGGDRSDPIETEFVTEEQSSTNPTMSHVTAPGGFVVTSKGSEQAEIMWTSASSPDYYLVEYKPTFSGQASPSTLEVYPPNTKAILQNLVPGTDYQVKIYAVVGSSQSEPASATFVTRIASPTNLRYTTGNNGVTLYWDNPIGPRAGIRVYYRRGSVEDSELLTGGSTQYVIPGGSSSDPIHVRVTAVGGNTESIPATLNITPGNRVSLRGVYLDNVSDRRADVVFRINPGVQRSGWTMTLSDESGSIGTPQELPDDVESVPLSNLLPGHVYNVSLMDRDNFELTRNEFMTKVAKPRNVNQRQINHNSVVLTWEAPPSPVIGYLVRYKNNADSSWLEERTTNPEIRLENLEPETYYSALVFALYQDTVMQRIETGIPYFLSFQTSSEQDPLPVLSPIIGLTISDITAQSAQIQWLPSRNIEVENYRVDLQRQDGGVSVDSRITRETSATFSNLLPDTRYLVSVRAASASRESQPVSQTLRTLAVYQPLIVSVENVNDTSFEVVWSHSAQGVTQYIVSAKKTDSREQMIVKSVRASARSQRFVNLHPATTYDVNVTPVIDDVLATTTSTSGTTELPSPANLYVDGEFDNSIRLLWDQPNVEIREYLVTYRPSDSYDGYRLTVRDRTEATLRSLSPNTSYVISVYSVYENRQSSPNTVMGQTSEAVTVAPPKDVRITDLQSPSSGSSSMTVEWQSISGHRYLVTATPEDETEPVFEESYATSSEGRIDGLLPHTNYVIKVYSIDASNNQRSNPVILQQKTKPRIPRNMRLVYVDGFIEFTWPKQNVSETEYLVKYRPEGGDWIERRVTEPRIILSDLQPNTNYQDISVQAIVNDEMSDPYRYPHIIRTKALSAPTDLNVSPQPDAGVGTYLVSWEPIDNYDEAYEISYHPSDPQQSRSITSRKNFLRLSNLLPGVGYVISVRPSTSDSPNSTITTRIVIPVPAPERVVIRDIGATRATVIFSAPNYDTVSLYEIRYYPVGRKSKLKLKRIGPQDAKRVDLEDLEPDTEYRVNVITNAGLKYSLPAGRNFATRPAPTERPIEPTPPSGGSEDAVTSDKLDDQTYRIRWRAHNGPVKYYKVAYQRQSGGQIIPQAVSKHIHELNLRLVPGENYVVSVVAVMTDRTTQTVGNLAVETNNSGSSSRSAIIEWDQTREDFVRFLITATPLRNPSARVLNWIRSGEENSFRLAGLHPGTHYQISVVGQTARGRNLTVLQTTLDTAVDSPTNFQVIRSTPNTITVQWNKPKAPIDGYTLTYQLDGQRETSHVPAPAVSDEQATIRSLSPGKRYVIRLYATSLTIPEDSSPAEVMAETPVPYPTRFHAPQVTPNLVGLLWEKPHDAITHYTLRVLDALGNVVVSDQRIEADDVSYTVRDLQPETRYRFDLTAWTGDSRSRTTSRNVMTARQSFGTRSNKTRITEDGAGYLIRWRGKARTVEGWLIVIIPNDGSETRKVRVDRFTKRFKLENLRPDVSYTVKIYPYSGETRGSPSVVQIPASQNSRTVTSTVWQMQIPQIRSDSVTLQWNTPWYGSEVEEYELLYKRQHEADTSYVLAPLQPSPGDNSISINNLEPGESYTIRLRAFHAGESGENRLTLTLMANITTPFPPPAEVQLQQLGNGSTLVTWQSSTLPITGYLVQYRLRDPTNERSFVSRRLSPETTNIALSFLKPGKTYEFRLAAEKGRLTSTHVSFQIDVPEQPANECTDPETSNVYQVGQNWTVNSQGYLLICTCNGPQTYDCDTGDWCHVDGNIYNRGQRWTKLHKNNKKEVCVCNGRAGYMCYPRSCQENGQWYSEGARWTSSLDGIPCSCVCPSQVTSSCETRCSST